MREHNLDPRVLDEKSQRLGDGTDGATDGRLVIALNFLEAENFERAVEIARTHPGLRYGVSVEVRPCKDPRAQAGTTGD